LKLDTITENWGWIVYALILLIWAGYLSQPTDDLQVTRDCEPSSGLGSIREKINPSEFWRLQKVALDKKIKALEKSLSEPTPFEAIEAMEETLKRESGNTKKEVDARLEQFYNENPSLRPSKGELEVRELREKADKLENKIFKEKMVARMRRETIKEKSDYSQCLAQLAAAQNN
jgi:hypothetical protein